MKTSEVLSQSICTVRCQQATSPRFPHDRSSGILPRVRPTRSILLVPLAFMACGTPQTPTTPAPAPPPVTSALPSVVASSGPSEKSWPAPTPIGADGKQTFASGATVVIAPGWSIAIKGNAALVVGPEPD